MLMTILIDLERNRVIDLLDGRDGAAFQAWLKAHPGVEIITRDRWSAYAEAASAGAPNARQVADRFHLVRNVRELVERLLDTHSSELDAAFEDSPPSSERTETPEISGETTTSSEGNPTPSPSSPQAAMRMVKRTRRDHRFAEVRRRRSAGQTIRHIARELRMSCRTVLKYLRRERCPDWRTGQPRLTRLDCHQNLVDEFIRNGGCRVTELLGRLREAGCRSSYDAVRRFFRHRLAAAGIRPTRATSRSPPKPQRPTTRQLSFESVRRAENRTVEQQHRMEKLSTIAGLQDDLKCVDGFLELVRGRVQSSLSYWLMQAEQSSSNLIRSFAKSIRSDESAVAAAMTTSWSNGMVEGHVNRLKAIKRSMLGRAKLPLLGSRVCSR